MSSGRRFDDVLHAQLVERTQCLYPYQHGPQRTTCGDREPLALHKWCNGCLIRAASELIATRLDDQPRSIAHPGEPNAQDGVIADIEARKALGLKRYGTLLQPNNGRDAQLDMYQELLDAAIYAKQVLMERANVAASIERVRGLVLFLEWQRYDVTPLMAQTLARDLQHVADALVRLYPRALSE